MAEKKTKKKKTKSSSKLHDVLKERDGFKYIASRAQADLVNYRNRVNSQIEESRALGKKILAIKILDIIDELDLAITAMKNNKLPDNLLAGLENVRSKFIVAFKSEQITEIDITEEFNPNFHEALLTTETDELKSDSIIKILRKGYMMNGKVIRPAQVEIAKEKTDQK